MKKIEQILLIDDDEINNFLNVRLLNQLGITKEIKVLHNGAEALDYIKSNCIKNDKICAGLVILDHHMPVMDGLEFMKEYNKLSISNRSAMVFIMLGASTVIKNRELLKELGVEEFASKPLSKQAVLDTYLKYFNKSEVKL
ncbi:MAG TPA: response regulator [Cytophagales bacterium]|nr:response regulator [Cytophagales bacterium]